MRGQGFSAQFDPAPGAVARARLFTRGLHVHLPEMLRACLELVVSELAANAVLHAGTPFVVAVSVGPPLRVEVVDGSPEPPVRQDSAVDAPSGRGLRLVEACSETWGYEVLPDGKVVWAELRA